jgi:hypothetical protein
MLYFMLRTSFWARQSPLLLRFLHTCKATLVQSTPVKERHGNVTVWEGVVHVFDLKGHMTATRAYAWSSPIEGSDKRRFFAVLHLPPVTSPAEAVRAAIVAENRG